VTTSGSPAVHGSTVVFTATVAPVAPGAGQVTGTVRFRVDGVPVGTPVPVNVAGQAVFSSSTLTVGTHQITARYAGDVNLNASTSPAITQRIT
jgi:large repetitive protein